MKTAEFIKEVENMSGDAKLYKVTPPAHYGWDDHNPSFTDHVVVSKINNAFGQETYIFPSNENGKIIDWAEMEGSSNGDYSHEEVLKEAGYSIKE